MSTFAYIGMSYPPEPCRGHSPYLYCGSIDCPQRPKIEAMVGPAIGTGSLVYADLFSGLIPCKIVSVVGDVVTVRLTASRKAYKRGEVIELPPTLVVPRNCVHVRSGQYRINPNYVITRDNPKEI